MLQKQEKRIWDTPLYADFPRSEYEDRVRRAEGVETQHLLKVIEEALEAEGMGSTIEMADHGVGLNPQEPPMITEEELRPIPLFPKGHPLTAIRGLAGQVAAFARSRSRRGRESFSAIARSTARQSPYARL